MSWSFDIQINLLNGDVIVDKNTEKNKIIKPISTFISELLRVNETAKHCDTVPIISKQDLPDLLNNYDNFVCKIFCYSFN